MNANELADYLQNKAEVELNPRLQESATMLRQQHTSLISDVEVIERLAKEIQVKDEAIFNSEKQAYNLAMQVQNQQAEIEALEASKDRLIKTLLDVRGQQPVAWGMTWKDGEIYDVISPAQHDKEEGDYNIPLYIHPVKELTDEEIDTIVRDFFGEVDSFYDFRLVIRRCIRKAQE